MNDGPIVGARRVRSARYNMVAAAFVLCAAVFALAVLADAGLPPLPFRGWPALLLVAGLIAGGIYYRRRYTAARTDELTRLNHRLCEQQRQLTTLIGNLPGMVYRCRNDADWTMEFVSDGCLALTGYAADDLLHNRRLSFAQLIHADDRERLWNEVQNAIAARAPYRLHYRLRAKDGTDKLVWEQGIAIWDEGGALQGLEGFITDVTAQYRMEGEHAKLDRHICLLLESTAEGVYGVDREGRCTFINNAGAGLLGYRPDELFGQSLHELIHRHPAERGAVGTEDCLVCARQRLSSDIRDEMVFWHRNGRAVQVECGFAPIREQDEIAGSVVCFTDTSERKASKARLHQLSQAVEQSPAAVVITDLLGNIEYVNSSFIRLTGYTATEVLGKNRMSLQSKTAAPAHLAELREALEMRGEWCGEVCSERKNGTHYWARESISTLRDDEGKAHCYLIIEEDVSRARAAEQALMKSQHRLEEAQRIASMGNWELDLVTGEIWWSDEIYRIYGWPLDVRPNYDLFVNSLHPEDKDRVVAAVEAAMHQGQDYSIEFRVKRPEGSVRTLHSFGEVVYDETGRAVLMQGTAQDITERKSTEQRLHYLAYYDDLTGLPNRTLFIDRLERAALEAKRHGRPLGLLFMDVDRFKHINETMGHEAGDALIVGVAQRLRGCVREVDSVARMGGDDFTILVSELSSGQEAATVARKILDGLRQPFVIGQRELIVTASIGISIYPSDGDDIKALLKNAGAAMDYAKEHGRNNYQFYSSHMTAAAFERLVLENSLRKALERDEFELYYQPQLSVTSGRVIGCEALLRWRHPELGLVSPMRFIPLAEDTGLIIPITEWVLRTACAQAQRWRAAGLPPMRMAVNISSRHFRETGLVEMVEQVLLESGLPPDHLELELTESVIMEHTEAAVQTIGRLWALGVQLAMDDFGTGYSSLSYLKRFPMQVLKIDRSFINDLTTDPGDAALTRAIILMAHSLDMQVVAEGVETAEQLEFLRNEGCDFIQGYYFSPPCPTAEFEQLLRSGRTL